MNFSYRLKFFIVAKGVKLVYQSKFFSVQKVCILHMSYSGSVQKVCMLIVIALMINHIIQHHASGG